MTTPLDPERKELLMKAFRMPMSATPRSRKSTVTNAFVNALFPVVRPTLEEVDEALAVLGMDPADVRCAYCGDRKTEWDHLRPIVSGRRPTGYISEIANLVPACGKCNQSKRNADWRDWTLSNANGSPTARAIADVGTRAARLDDYTRWRTPRRVDLTQIVPATELEDYWKLLDGVVDEMERCQPIADDIRKRIQAYLATDQG
jgi:hypothetical protein